MSNEPSGRAERLGVAALAGAALLLRIVPPWRHVLADGRVWFQETDAWYHVRVAEAWIESFPRRLRFDPWLSFPAGGDVPVGPSFDLLLALPGVLLRLSEHASRVWMALVPPILGALGVVLLWGLGRCVFDRRTGLLAGALLAVEPGGFLQRSLLGVADHHVLEAVLAMAVLWALCAAMRFAGAEPAASHTGRGALLRSGGAGLLLGCYLLSWSGGALLVAIATAFVVVQTLAEPGGPEDAPGHPALLLFVSFAAAAATLALGGGLTPGFEIQALALGGGAAVAGILAWGLRLARTSALGPMPRRLVGVLLVATVGGLGVAATALLRPALLDGLLGNLRRFAPGAAASTVAEVRPLLRFDDTLSLVPAWLHFRATFFLGLAGWIGVLEAWLRRRDRAAGLVLVYGAGMLLATLCQNRFGYYLAPALALFAAALVSALADAVVAAGRGERVRAPARLAVAAIALVCVLYPTVAAAIGMARRDLTPPAGWRRAMEWLRSESAPPFGGATPPSEREPSGAATGGDLAAPAYGVLSWWDYGYWILTLGRRVPFSNPTQTGAAEAGKLLLLTEPAEAWRRLDARGLRYVVTDPAMTARWKGAGLSFGVMPAMATWAGVDESTFWEWIELEAGGARSAIFHPSYYRTLAVRLARFGVGAVPATGPVWVVELAANAAGEPRSPRRVLSRRAFASFEEAKAQLAAGMVRGTIVGDDPERSPIPLAPVPGIELRHESDGVRIYETVIATTPGSQRPPGIEGGAAYAVPPPRLSLLMGARTARRSGPRQESLP
jgi:dolichyl-diphosphooligosaccharide--protein glycosyltransferase